MPAGGWLGFRRDLYPGQRGADVAGDADTLAGLLLELKGDFLSLHEKIDYDNYTFEVMGVERRRISRVKVTVHEKKQDASE